MVDYLNTSVSRCLSKICDFRQFSEVFDLRIKSHWNVGKFFFATNVWSVLLLNGFLVFASLHFFNKLGLQS